MIKVLVKRQSLTPLRVLRSSESLKIPLLNISNYTTVLIESISSNMAQNSSQNLNIADNINSLNVVNVNTMISDEDNQILEWLSPLKTHQRHQSVRADRIDGVGNWFLETSEFWRCSNGADGSRGRVLSRSGGPGVGKTYLWYEHPSSGNKMERRSH